jgi:hypothetical protein
MTRATRPGKSTVRRAGLANHNWISKAGLRLLLGLPWQIKKGTVKNSQLNQPDMIPEGESVKPDDEDLDNIEGDDLQFPTMGIRIDRRVGSDWAAMHFPSIRKGNSKSPAR